MFELLLIKLYFTIIGLSIVGCGLFSNLALKAKSFEEEMKWEKYMIFSFAICVAMIGLGLVSLIWL